jgi:hypothetical protein
MKKNHMNAIELAEQIMAGARAGQITKDTRIVVMSDPEGNEAFSLREIAFDDSFAWSERHSRDEAPETVCAIFIQPCAHLEVDY